MKTRRRVLLFLSISFFLSALCGCDGGDGGGDSGNVGPVADAGSDQIVTVSESLVALNGNNSRDVDGDGLSYRWELLVKPDGSNAFLLDPSTATPILDADIEGTYQIILIVTDADGASNADTVTVTIVELARNIILIIGDGMGFEQVRAAGMYANGEAGSLSFEGFPAQGSVATLNANGNVTDSAAAATAMATGIKVNNGVISLGSPGDSSELETILEAFMIQDASTGLVTTTTITHATPAAFAAHELSRSNQSEIALGYLTDSQPNVLFGGAQFIDPGTAQGAGYTVIEDRDSMLDLDTEIQHMVWGQFGETHLPYELDGLGLEPHLSEMTEISLDILDNDPDGFFLMIEGGRIDHAGHINDIERNVFETMELSNTVQVVMALAAGRTDTLIVVTADHETGGLHVVANNGEGNFPVVTWDTVGHTASEVPVYAWGVNAHLVTGGLDNTEIFEVMFATAFGN